MSTENAFTGFVTNTALDLLFNNRRIKGICGIHSDTKWAGVRDDYLRAMTLLALDNHPTARAVVVSNFTEKPWDIPRHNGRIFSLQSSGINIDTLSELVEHLLPNPTKVEAPVLLVLNDMSTIRHHDAVHATAVQAALLASLQARTSSGEHLAALLGTSDPEPAGIATSLHMQCGDGKLSITRDRWQLSELPDYKVEHDLPGIAANIDPTIIYRATVIQCPKG